jgi:lipopolysaccharide biosynthesis regulator YciM
MLPEPPDPKDTMSNDETAVPTARKAIAAVQDIAKAEHAEVERLRGLIGKLYVSRGEDVHTLRCGIRRAFFESGQTDAS